MIFELTIENHKYNGVIVPRCRVYTSSVQLVPTGTCTTQTEYYAIDGDVEYYQTTKTDIFQVDLELPIKPQVAAYFEAIFGSNTEA